MGTLMTSEDTDEMSRMLFHQGLQFANTKLIIRQSLVIKYYLEIKIYDP